MSEDSRDERRAEGGGASTDLDEVRRIVLQALADFPVSIYLFGSRARRESRVSSDIDVGILPRAPLPSHVLSELRERLEESRAVETVDIVDLSTTDSAFREHVLREGIPWR